MSSFYFWNDWNREHKILYGILGLLFSISVLYFLFSLVIGADAILGWESLMQSEAVETVIDQISQAPFTLPVLAESFVFIEYFNGGAVMINEGAYYIFLLFTGIGLVFVLSVITYLPRFWYMVAMGLFVVLVIFFKLELLLLFDSTSKLALIIALGLYLPTSYYFQSFNRDISITKRVLVFALITVLFAMVIKLSAGVDLPFMQMAIYGMPALLIVAIIFNLLVSHDIIAGFLNAVSSGTTSVGNWKHFFVITAIYLINVLILYLNAVGIIIWDFLPINVFILLLISALVGIWGYRQREPQYEYLYPFNPLGAILYLSMAMLTFSTIAFFYATGNDPILDVIHDIVIYSHLGYGFVFVMYVASNFLNMLTKGLPVSRILYKPGVMPYFTYRFAGIIAFGALLFLQNWELPVEKSFAGYYNGLGDLHTVQDELILANGYYLQGSQYGYSNHRSNYSLALNAEKDKNIEKAIEHYKRSNFSWPTEYSYINLSNLYIGSDRYFDALFSLNEGLRKFPDSGPIMNNLGLLYSKIDVFDSAIFYLEEAVNNSESERTAKNNLLAVLAKNRADINLEEQNWMVREGDPVNIANSYALYNSSSKAYLPEYPLEVTGVNQFIHTSVYNYLINMIWRSDTLSYALADSVYGSNMFLDRRLILGKALNRYYEGEVRRGYELMNEIRVGDLFWTGDMNFLIGLWNLDNAEWDFAIENMELARDNYNQYGQFGLAVSHSLAGNIEEAIIAWDSVKNQNIKQYSELAEEILPILKEKDAEIVGGWEDRAKYQWMKFHEGWEEEIVSTFTDQNYLAAAYLDYVIQLIEEDKLSLAAEVIGRTDSLDVTLQELGDRLTATFLEISARAGDIRTIAAVLDQGFEIKNPVDNDHYHALLYEAAGDTLAADQLFSKWEFKNPFEEALAVSASRFYERRGNLDKAYMWLQKAASLNSNSLFLQKNYVRMCGQLGYDSFGRYVLGLLEEMMDPDQFSELSDQFERDIQTWNNSNF